MATYSQIKSVAEDIGGFKVETCWIADVKEQVSLPMRHAPNRQDPNRRKKPCPLEKKGAIVAAMRRLKMI
jgi:hypothetical protein